MPLVLTHHPFNIHFKRYLLQNFRILSTDQQTRDMFPRPHFVAYQRDLSLRDILVHSTDKSSTDQSGPRADDDVNALGNLHCISCYRCSHIYIGEAGQSLRRRFGEHLRSIRNNTPAFPAAQHFHSAAHSITDVQVWGMRLCRGTYIIHKQLEMKQFFQLGMASTFILNTFKLWARFLLCARGTTKCCYKYISTVVFHTEEGISCFLHFPRVLKCPCPSSINTSY